MANNNEPGTLDYLFAEYQEMLEEEQEHEQSLREKLAGLQERLERIQG